MENLHREEKGGQHFRRGNNRSKTLEAVKLDSKGDRLGGE